MMMWVLAGADGRGVFCEGDIAVFLTGPEFLHELREQCHRTLTLIDASTSKGHTRVVDMNQQVLTNLDRMIGEAEQTNRKTPPMRTDSHHIMATTRRRTAATRKRAVSARRRMDKAGLPITFDAVKKPGPPAPGSTTNPTCAPNASAHDKPHPSPGESVPDRQRASDGSLLRRLESASERIQQLETKNQQLREALAIALGEHRAADLGGTAATRRQRNPPRSAQDKGR